MSKKLYELESAMIIKPYGKQRVGDLLTVDQLRWYSTTDRMDLSTYQQLRMLKAKETGETEKVAQEILAEPKRIHEVIIGHLTSKELEDFLAGQKAYVEDYLTDLTQYSDISNSSIVRVLAAHKVEVGHKKITWDELKEQNLYIDMEEGGKYEEKQLAGRDMRGPRKYDVRLDCVTIRLTGVYIDNLASLLWNVANWFDECQASDLIYEARANLVKNLELKVKGLYEELDIEAR